MVHFGTTGTTFSSVNTLFNMDKICLHSASISQCCCSWWWWWWWWWWQWLILLTLLYGCFYFCRRHARGRATSHQHRIHIWTLHLCHHHPGEQGHIAELQKWHPAHPVYQQVHVHTIMLVCGCVLTSTLYYCTYSYDHACVWLCFNIYIILKSRKSHDFFLSKQLSLKPFKTQMCH